MFELLSTKEQKSLNNRSFISMIQWCLWTRALGVLMELARKYEREEKEAKRHRAWLRDGWLTQPG